MYPKSSSATQSPLMKLPTPVRDDLPGVTLRLPTGREQQIWHTSEIPRLSQFWTYVVAERRRHSEMSLQKLRSEAQIHLAHMMDFGASDRPLSFEERKAMAVDFLQAATEEVEVTIPYSEEKLGWDWRTMPWESLLSLATKEWRGERPLLVCRHLEVQAPCLAQTRSGMLLLVTSSPGKLRDHYQFESEVRLVRSNLVNGGSIQSCELLIDPDFEALKVAVAQHQPDVIHLSMIDTHQAEGLLGATVRAETKGTERFDGVCLRHPTWGIAGYSAIDMANALTIGGTHKPQLVAFNCYNSGARLAAMAVARGAQAALGFQDTIDDLAAEEYFATFYREWAKDKTGHFHEALQAARKLFKQLPVEQQGGDLVLWSNASIFSPIESTPIAVVKPARSKGRLSASRSGPPQASAIETSIPSTRAEVSAELPLTVTINPFDSLNYSLLHNNGDLFEKFIVHNFQKEAALIRVVVKLHLGAETFPFEGEFEIPPRKGIPLAKHIRVPLVAGLLRGQRESIQTNLSIEVTAGGRVLRCLSHPVLLLPADEWNDNPSDRHWLPSFVLPRDPAVLRVLDAATRYLRALTDDSRVGFDGYQAFDREEPDAGAKVDAQVRALWSALLYDLPLVYINPPPSYTPGAQRLRIPSQVLNERRATCIDLAVLLASCLEYVGIYPVMFLIQGHAFPGYWRNPKAREDFIDFGDALFETSVESDAGGAGPGKNQRPAWVFAERKAFAEIASAIQRGGLVPIESTELTSGGSFARSLELGLKNLGTGWIFDAMIDIQKARDKYVRPLPFCPDNL